MNKPLQHPQQAPVELEREPELLGDVAQRVVDEMRPANALEVAARVEHMSAPLSETAAIFQVIERAAMNPNVDLDKMERLLQMQERVMARNARGAYMAALAQMQGELPVISRHGKITIRDKNDENKIRQATPYALWEDINEAIKPVLQKHGFALSFRTGMAPDGKLTVTGILSHRDGHQEETTMSLPHDSTGSKNAVQAVGSSTSYGKRYTASALLNLTSRGEDDDGKAAGDPSPINDEQLKALRDLIDLTGTVETAFCEYLKIASLPELPASRYVDAQKALGKKMQKRNAEAVR